MDRLRIKVTGTVQGVGFRPYVYGLAVGLGLRGFVANTSGGVTIEVEGKGTERFLSRLEKEAPPLASIASVEATRLPARGFSAFSITESADRGGFTMVSPDVSICPECLRELEDPSDRRFGYPFINCTNCGPRYTITRRLPYDRPNTTMAPFDMCAECSREYEDPGNRRFHAQPNACFACGPALSGNGPGLDDAGDPIEAARGLLLKGRIVAVKGLGGYHLACDAENGDAVSLLRRRKRRTNKPFALMAPDVKAAMEFCHVSSAEAALLSSARRPIVLLKKKTPQALPEAVAPGNPRLGFMLPYTPLHHMLARGFKALVMTSGNLAEEPVIARDDEALIKLSPLADAFLGHNRDIFMRADDSVVRAEGEKARFVRRARGYVPEPIALGVGGPDVLAAGADIKNTFTILKGPFAIVSQHIGDMENHETLVFFEEALRNLKSLYRAEPVALAFDLHPGYLSSGWAMRQGLPLLGVQHHHAHIASVMAEKRLEGKVIGVAFDGSGYGTDGALWGGEFLVADPTGFKRAAHLRPAPLPGGERAVREPWRTAVSRLMQAFGREAPSVFERMGFFERYGRGRVGDVLRVAHMKEFSPPSTGAGRLFDAVSALLGLCGENTFEAEAATALEAHASVGDEGGYPVDIVRGDPIVVDFTPCIRGIIGEMEGGEDTSAIACRFHNTVARAVVETVAEISKRSGLKEVALSGGAFQNDLLLRRASSGLAERGLNVHTNGLVPANDGGISLGQAYVLRETLRLKGGRL